MTCLPDVNVWIALAANQHARHHVARHWFGNLQEEILVFSRLTMREEVMTSDGAWQAYHALRSDRRIGYLAEPTGLAETWNAFTEGRLSSPNLWTDAYLCAFAHAARLTLVTFDAKIPARVGVNCLVLGGTTAK